jgi:hypothetical protein
MVSLVCKEFKGRLERKASKERKAKRALLGKLVLPEPLAFKAFKDRLELEASQA